MNRGSQVARHLRSLAARASMRPRFMNRGSESILRSDLARARSFNEAPIHESGKFRSSRFYGNASCSCFNEAPIHESGK